MSATRWVVLLFVSILCLVIVYLGAVWTPFGQEFESSALRGGGQVALLHDLDVRRAFEAVTVWSLVLAIGAVGLIGVFRKQFVLTGVSLSVIFFGHILTQILKRVVLERPDFVNFTGNFGHNSFPSGHTTLAMTTMVALFLVMPYRARGIAMLFAIPWAAAIGAYTLTAGWHRLSDTIGATLIALIMGAIAAIVLQRMGRIIGLKTKPKKLRVTSIAVTLFAVIGAFLVAFLLAAVNFRSDLHNSEVEWNMFLSAITLTTATAAVSALWYWASWRRLEIAA